jgi:hypothetical protein
MQKLLCVLFVLLLAGAGCTKSSDDNSGTNDPQVNSGKWKVTFYWDKDKDETSDFSGYAFEFQSNGTLLATVPGGTTVSGTWSITSTKFIISITGTDPLNSMTHDWLLLEKTDTLIRLQDDNTTHQEELHLEKL